MRAAQPLGVLEDLRADRVPAGRLAGTRVTVTRWAWASPFLMLGQGGAFSLLCRRAPLRRRLTVAVAFGLAGTMTNLVHALGHLLSSRLTGAPMDELVVTATRIVNVYRGDQTGYPPRVHLGRAVGGPAANLALAALCFFAGRCLPAGPARASAWLLAAQNGAAGVLALLPIPTADGEVIWRELGRLRANRPLRTRRQASPGEAASAPQRPCISPAALAPSNSGENDGS